jgi:KUP system potassium uptake protein
VIIDNVYINDFLLTIRDKIILNIYNFVKKLGSNDFTAYGVASHNVVVESAPLLDQKIKIERIEKVEHKHFE